MNSDFLPTGIFTLKDLELDPAWTTPKIRRVSKACAHLDASLSGMWLVQTQPITSPRWENIQRVAVLWRKLPFVMSGVRKGRLVRDQRKVRWGQVGGFLPPGSLRSGVSLPLQQQLRLLVERAALERAQCLDVYSAILTLLVPLLPLIMIAIIY